MSRIPTRARVIPLALILLAGCGSQDSTAPTSSSSTEPNTSAHFLSATGANVVPITLGGSTLCGQNGYANEPCISVTICVPGTSNCQTIKDILVDTGSVGLRVFSSLVTIPLTNQTDSNGNTIAECAQFGTGSDWGPVAQAGVVLGSETAVTTPIQLINLKYATPPSACSQADTSPTSAGYNGIMGVGLFQQDCGTICSTPPPSGVTIGVYYSCTGSGTCTSATIALNQQLQNPVSLLPKDNNGVIIALPQIGTTGAGTVSGNLILGIGTESNNVPSGVKTFVTDADGNFTTTFSGSTLSSSFVDSGSNGLFFPNVANITECPTDSGDAGFYCPTSAQNLSATTISANNSTQESISFQVADANTILSGKNDAFYNLDGEGPDGTFDWGLPFFYGRAVFNGIQNTTSSLGTGPYWAY